MSSKKFTERKKCSYFKCKAKREGWKLKEAYYTHKWEYCDRSDQKRKQLLKLIAKHVLNIKKNKLTHGFNHLREPLIVLRFPYEDKIYKLNIFNSDKREIFDFCIKNNLDKDKWCETINKMIILKVENEIKYLKIIKYLMKNQNQGFNSKVLLPADDI